MPTAEQLLDAALNGDAFVGDDDDDDFLSGDDVGYDPFLGAETPKGIKTVKQKGLMLRLVIPFSSPAAIAAGAVGTATNKPQFKMRVDRIAVAASISAAFVVNSITVGQRPIFVSQGNLHSDLLSSAAYGVSLAGWTCEAALDITFGVTNISAAPATFYAGIFGPTLT
jgi:hypothetical protein